MRTFLLTALIVFSLNLSQAHAEPAANPALAVWQNALDKLAGGDVAASREILQAGIKRDGPAEPTNMLLAWLLQQAGDSTAALAALAQVPDSPLARSLALEIKNAPPKPQLTATERLLIRLETAMIVMVNAERKKNGLKDLEADEKLTAVARGHAAEMRDKDYFSHQSPTKGLRDPMDRYIKIVGATPHVLAENIYKSGGATRTLRETDIREGHIALMDSPGHRRNIMLDDVTRIGIGLAVNPRGDFWVTQVFARP